jgi:hypothetical protein
MHVMIGLMFGPVVWFALLMITLAAGAYMPSRLLTRLERFVTRLETGWRRGARAST